MHNYACRTFLDAANLLGADKKKSLLKFSNSAGDDQEVELKEAFSNLFGECNRIAGEKFRKKMDQLQESIDLLKSAEAKSALQNDLHFEFLDKLFIFMDTKLGPLCVGEGEKSTLPLI